MIKAFTLGQCALEIGGERLGPESEVLFALALYLVVERGRRTTRGALMALLWPDADEKAGSHNIRQAVYRLRKSGVQVSTDRSDVWIDPDACDADFAPLQSVQAALDVESLAASITGPFLPGYAPRFSPPFADWLERQRDLCNAAIRRVLVAALASTRSRGDWSGVETLASRLLALDPLNEEATLARAEAAAVHGGKAHAIAILDRYVEEVGPAAREIKIPASMLRRRIAEAPAFDESQRVTEPLFVGRADEMAQLNHALQQARAGQGSAHLLWGEPGIGKSRIAREFVRAASLGRLSVARVACSASDERRPLSAFVDVVPTLLGLPGGLGCAPESMPYLRRLTGTAPHESLPSPESREASYLYSRIRRSILDLVDAVAGEACLLLEIEDVHWLDAMSWDVLGEMLPWLATRRVLVLLTSREAEPDARRGPALLGGLRRHHVAPLTDAAGRQLLDALLPGGAGPAADDFREWCVRAGHGNPYYLAELAMHDRDPGARDTLPASLAGLLAERLVRLHPAARRVLQACALMGRHSTAARLETVLAESRLALVDALDELELHGLVATEGVTVAVKHDLLAQAAVSRLSAASRQLLHRHVAECLERESGVNQPVAALWDCAEHWQQAGDVTRAIRFLRECARHALEVGIPAEAGELLERATELVTEPELRVELLRTTAHAWTSAGRWHEVLRVLDQLTSLERTAGIPLGTAHTDEELLALEARWHGGGEGLPVLEAVSDCAAEQGATLEHRISAALMAVRFAENCCAPESAHAAYRCVASHVHYQTSRIPARLNLELVYHASFGEHERAVAAGRQLVEAHRVGRNAAALSRAIYHLATALRAAGHIPEALARLVECQQLAATHSLSWLAGASAISLSWIYRSAGDLGSAEAWHGQALDWATHVEDKSNHAGALGLGAILALGRGEYDLAERLLKHSVTLFGSTSPERVRVLNVGLELLIEVRRGRRPSASRLDEFLTLFRRTRTHLSQDFAAETAVELLIGDGRAGAAAETLREFVNVHRRERGPLSVQLQRLATSLHVENLHVAGRRPADG